MLACSCLVFRPAGMVHSIILLANKLGWVWVGWDSHSLAAAGVECKGPRNPKESVRE